MTHPGNHIHTQLQTLIRGYAPTGRLLVALSGGRDSTVLLHLLARSFPDRDIVALHVDHGLHPRSSEWTGHCRNLATELGVGFDAFSVRVETGRGESLEASAREARYQALAEAMLAGDTLLTAHHAGDQLETLIYRLARGAGGRGLAGIRRQRPLGPGQLLRPLLSVEEAAIQAYAEAHRLSWVEDPSNRDERFDRNYLRHHVLPVLLSRWPTADRQAARSAEHLADEARLLQEVGEADLRELLDEDRLNLTRLETLSRERRRNALRCWLEASLDYPPGSAWLERLEQELIGARVDASPELVLGAFRVRRHGDWIYLVPGTLPSLDPGPHHWDAPDPCVELPGNGRLCLDPDPVGKGVCLPARVTIRYRRPGDVFHDGRHHRKLKEWLRLAEIPEEERDRLPLLLDGEIIFAIGETLLDPRYIAGDTVQKGARSGTIQWYRAGQDGRPD